MSTENIEKEVAGMSGKDALQVLIVQQARKDFFCPPYTEEAAVSGVWGEL